MLLEQPPRYNLQAYDNVGNKTDGNATELYTADDVAPTVNDTN